ncbi:MAG TPA: hypothetical protein VGD71_19295 [Kribbella sp.]|jgi:hypothetical protein
MYEVLRAQVVDLAVIGDVVFQLDVAASGGFVRVLLVSTAAYGR